MRKQWISCDKIINLLESFIFYFQSISTFSFFFQKIEFNKFKKFHSKNRKIVENIFFLYFWITCAKIFGQVVSREIYIFIVS